MIPGSILKIAVENFVTYTHGEMYPGSNLNMIIAPNGTGKSSIVAAIILGLGGSPKTVGRGNNVSEYVKHNCTNSTIKITLQGADSDEKYIVTRHFDIEGNNTWKLNSKIITQKKLHEFTKKLNIQVDNLCQFLPQDRVQEFAKMNKQQLLKETLAALCRHDLLNKQEELIENRDKHKKLLESLEKLNTKFQQLSDENVRIEGSVMNFNRKTEYLETIKSIERKIAWIEYSALLERKEEVKEDRKLAQELHEKRKCEMLPTENALKEVGKLILSTKAEYMKTLKSQKNIEETLQSKLKVMSQLKEKITRIEDEKKNELRELEQRDQEIESSLRRCDQLQQTKSELVKKYGDENIFETQKKVYEEKTAKINNEIRILENKKIKVDDVKQNKIYECHALENEIKKMENVQQQRLQFLRSYDDEAFKATIWLRENKNMFENVVYEPLILELNILNPNHSKYLENYIPFRDRVAFICTSKKDMNLFINVVRGQMKYNVNVIYVDPNDQLRNYQPIVPIENLKKYGFFAYLHSLFTGPEPLMAYLCRFYNIHTVPVGNSTTNNYYENLPKEIKTFFSDSYRYSISTSKYSGEKITLQTDIKSDGSFSTFIDTNHLEEIRSQINEIQNTIRDYSDELRQINVQINTLNESKYQFQKKLNELQVSKNEIANIEKRIAMLKNKTAQLRANTQTEEDVNKRVKSKISGILQSITATLREISDTFNFFLKALVDQEFNKIQLSVHEQKSMVLENKLLELQRHCSESEDNLRRLEDIYSDVSNRTKVALKNAKSLSKGFSPDDRGFDEFRREYDALPSDTEDLLNEKEHVLSKIDCLNVANDDVITEFENRKREIEDVKNNIAKSEEELIDLEKNMTNSQEEWLTPINNIIDSINKKFNFAFENLGCAGEVSLFKGENEQDYNLYGINIKVTYRSGEPLQELNSSTQSGGERAVATAVYILSLQEMTPVPFRCVDEINQGMDAINEKRIFDLLVKLTSQVNTSQYFFITPKLVPGLVYSEQMKIHVVHNGPFIKVQF